MSTYDSIIKPIQTITTTPEKNGQTFTNTKGKSTYYNRSWLNAVQKAANKENPAQNPAQKKGGRRTRRSKRSRRTRKHRKN